MGFLIQGLDPALFGSLYDQKQGKFNNMYVAYHDVAADNLHCLKAVAHPISSETSFWLEHATRAPNWRVPNSDRVYPGGRE